MMSCETHGGSLPRGHSQTAECTPEMPPPTPWGKPVGNGDPDVDHQEVTFLRGEVGFPRAAILTSCPAQPDGAWEPRGQPPYPQHLFNLMRM